MSLSIKEQMNKLNEDRLEALDKINHNRKVMYGLELTKLFKEGSSINLKEERQRLQDENNSLEMYIGRQTAKLMNLYDKIKVLEELFKVQK